MARIKKNTKPKESLPKSLEKSDREKRHDRHVADIKNAIEFQNHNGWKTCVKRTMAMFTGHFSGFEDYDSKYILNTYYGLVNLVLPNLYFRQPYIICRNKKPILYQKGTHGKYKAVDGERCANILSAAVNDACVQLEIETEIRGAIQDAMTHGWGVIKVGVRGKTVSAPDTESQAKMLFVQRFNPLDLLRDPFATSPRNARHLIHRFVSHKAQLQSNKTLDKAVLDKLEPQQLIEDTKAREIKDELKDIQDIDLPVECYEYHDQLEGRIYLYGKGVDDYVLLEEKDNPHTMEGSHFVVLKFTGDNDEWSGISMLGAIEDEALAVNQMIELMVKHFSRFPGVVVHTPNAIAPSEKDKWENAEQGSFLEAESLDQVEFKSPTPMGQEYFSGLITFNQMIDRISGIPDFQRGGSRTRKTATENILESGDANIRRDFYVQLVRLFVLEIARKLIALIQQYYDEEEVVQITGEFVEWPKFTKNDIQGEYLCDLDITDMIKFSQTQAQGILNAFQALGQNPEAMAYFNKEVDIPKLTNVVLRGFGVDLAFLKKPKPLIREEYDPYAENELVRQGRRLPDPLPHEPHDQHLAVHEPASMEYETLGEAERAHEIKRHMDMHLWMSQRTGVQAAQLPQALPQSQPSLETLLSQSQQQQGAAPAASEVEGVGGFSYPTEKVPSK